MDFLGLNEFLSFIKQPEVWFIIKMVYYLLPFLIVLLVIVTLFRVWLTYKRTEYFASLSYTVLEIKLPKEIFKSPLSMEFLFNALYQTGGEEKFKWPWKDVITKDDGKIKVDFSKLKIQSEYYLKGQTRPWYSFEICSIGGKIKFFIWTRSNFKNLIEANLYSQFPGIEIFEVTDYTLPISYDPSKNSIWGTEFELTKADSFPIKTYIDYGMDKDPKEEYKIDPMTPLVEFLSSVGEKHNIWIQIIARAHIAEDFDKESGKMVDNKWVKSAQAEIKKIQESVKPQKVEGKDTPPPRALTQGEQDTIKALERSISKVGFDVGIRAFYVANKDVFDKSISAGVIAGFKHYSSNNLNGFKPRKGASPDKNDDKRDFLYAYKSRGYFYNEFADGRPYFVLNTEELATIYHFPGQVSTVPTFERIESKKALAPGNLPT
jgi:hypothetical protein